MQINNINKDKLVINALIFLLGFIIAFFLLRRCDNTPKPQSTVITQIKHTRDTIWAKDTLYTFKNIKIKVPVKVTDTIYKPLPVDSSICKTVSLYEDSLIDTNLVIHYKDHVQGLLLNKSLSYRLKVPVKIIDSIRIKETLITKPNFNLSAGSILGLNVIAPGIKIRYKQNEFGINYNIINPKSGLMVHWKYILIEK
jgi:hypothetical protein